MTPDEIDEFLDKAQIYHDGMMVNDMFYTWSEYDRLVKETLHEE